MSPATQIVVAAGWLGTRRAIQATREGVTDLRNRLKLDFSTIFSHQVYWDQDGGREGPPFTRNPHRTCWRSSYALFSCENFAVHIYMITIFVAQVGTSPHFGFVSASEFFLVALVALEWVKSEGKSLFVCHPAEEGEYGGAVGDLSRCNGGKEDARVVLESKG